MKIMHLLSASLFLTAVLFTACTPDKHEDPPNLSVDHTSIVHSTSAGTESITINSNINWTLSVPSTATWLQVDKTSGSKGTTTITLTFSTNPSTDPMVTDLTLSGNGVTNQKIHIVQNGSAVYINVDKNSLNAQASDTKDSVEVTSNNNWTLSIPTSVTWITADKSSGSSGIAKVHFTIKANTSTDSRSANITISSAASGVTPVVISLTQVPDYKLTDFTPASASAGNDITLTGVFGTNPAVMVNGVTAVIKSSSSSQIVFTVPSSATTGKITVSFGNITLTSTSDLVVAAVVVNPIVWSKVFGNFIGNIDYTNANSIKPTPDGGYIMAGSTYNTNNEALVMKLDGNGGMVWQHTLGGSSQDYAYSTAATSDGGYILAGSTASNDGDVTGNHGGYDAWIVKLDGSGNKLWQKVLGGSGDDAAKSIVPTSDGGYIIAGYTNSNDGNVYGSHGLEDVWVVKLNGSGAILWQKALGGSGYDKAESIFPTSNGGYIIVGSTTSTDGDITGNHGYTDAWVVKLDGSGTLVWQKALGGSSDDNASSITLTSEGGYIIAGNTHSIDGDVIGNHGGYDAWIVKLDASGNKVWQKALGGSGNDDAYSIATTSDGGYVMSGYTKSTDGDITGNHGKSDAWICKLDGSGTLVWQRALGGAGDDDANAKSIISTSDGSYIMAGSTESNDGDVSGNYGKQDAWIVKLKF